MRAGVRPHLVFTVKRAPAKLANESRRRSFENRVKSIKGLWLDRDDRLELNLERKIFSPDRDSGLLFFLKKEFTIAH